MKCLHRLLFAITIAVASAQVHAASQSDPECASPPEILAAKITLVGELHGSNETPAWIAKLACAISQDYDLIVALEIPREEQSRLNIYLSSAGTAADRAKLLSGPFWQVKDGRASQAMVSLIERIRKLRYQKRNIRILAIVDAGAQSSKDSAMAASIRAVHVEAPQAKILALMGNYHASEAPRDPDDHPTGFLLRDLLPLTVLAAYQTGTTWGCMPDCEVHTLTSKWGQAHAPGFYPGQSPLDGYQATQVLGSITAAPPSSHSTP